MSSSHRILSIPCLVVVMVATSCGSVSDEGFRAIHASDASKRVEGTLANLMTTLPRDHPLGQRQWRFPDIGPLSLGANNSVHLSFDSPIQPPAPGELTMRQLLADGEFGPDLLADGVVGIIVGSNGASLRLRENGRRLVNQAWYAIQPTDWPGVAPFRVNVFTLLGDFDVNGTVLAADVLAINSMANGRRPQGARDDINGDGFKTQADVLILNAHVGTAMPPKPSGH